MAYKRTTVILDIFLCLAYVFCQKLDLGSSEGWQRHVWAVLGTGDAAESHDASRSFGRPDLTFEVGFLGAPKKFWTEIVPYIFLKLTFFFET